MLGRIFKYDLKATARLFIPMYFGLFIITLINKACSELLLARSRNQGTILSEFTTTFTILYIIAIIASFVLTIIFVTVHFYKTMVGDQAYLTFTLPVKTSTHLTSKFLLAIFWLIITTISTIISFFIMLAGYGYLNFAHLKITIDAIDAALMAEGLIGSISSFFGILLLLMVVSFIHLIMMIFTSIALGQQFRKSKIGGSVISYIGLYLINQMISTIFVFTTGFFKINEWVTNGIDFMKIMNGYLASITIYYIIIVIVYYFLSNYLFQKRLNLE